MAAPPKDCRIVIEAGDLKRGAALRNACERAKNAVAIPCYADAERDLARIVDEELREAGLAIAPDARATLIPLLGGDRRASSEASASADIARMRRAAVQFFSAVSTSGRALNSSPARASSAPIAYFTRATDGFTSFAIALFSMKVRSGRA